MDKRKHPREEAFLVGEVKNNPIYISDISREGLRISSESVIGKKGEKITIQVTVPSSVLDNISIDGEIAWIRKIQEFQMAGIHILNYDYIQKNLKYIVDLNNFISKLRENLLS
jgi:hypothetical protein